MDARKIDPDRERLFHLLGQAEEQIEALRASVRWRLGSAAVEFVRRIRGQPPVPTAFDRLAEVFASLRDWRQESAEEKESALDQPVAMAERSPRYAADIVICVHDTPEYVEGCLESLIACTNLTRHNIILVDDGSSLEATHQLLRQFVSKVPSTLIRNPSARGYTVAANQGIAAGKHEFVVLLNSDTILTPGWLDKLIRCAEVVGDAAVVGPLSNAASWQSIPKLIENGAWCVNSLPAGLAAADLAAEIDRWSPSLYPSTTLVNGFCYMISRRALEQVGLLDEANFPRGYGEEDDFSLRCLDHGLRLFIADDTYVFHAKTKSFTSQGRAELVRSAKCVLAKKHGIEKVRRRLRELAENEDLVRARTFASLVAERAGRPAEVPDLRDLAPRIGWLVPHLGEVGGVRRIIEMSNRLVRWGCRVELITPDGAESQWLPILADVVSFEARRSREYDVLVVTDPDVVQPFLHLTARHRIVYHLAAYMVYRPENRELADYYCATSNCVHIANSRWTAERVKEHAGVEVRAVLPGGVDKRLFHPCRRRRIYDVAAYGSARRHKGTATVVEATRGLRLLRLADLRAPQRDLPWHICSARVFASGCWHEGFNFLPLEAMACGVPVVMTDDGGSREYAVDGENALVVPVKDAAAMREQLDRLLGDPALRTRLIANGLATAWRFEWDGVTAKLADLVRELAGPAGVADRP